MERHSHRAGRRYCRTHRLSAALFSLLLAICSGHVGPRAGIRRRADQRAHRCLTFRNRSSCLSHADQCSSSGHHGAPPDPSRPPRTRTWHLRRHGLAPRASSSAASSDRGAPARCASPASASWRAGWWGFLRWPARAIVLRLFGPASSLDRRGYSPPRLQSAKPGTTLRPPPSSSLAIMVPAALP